MLPAWFVVFSVLVRLIGGGKYARGVMQGRARPNPFTWFLWGLTPMIAFFAQLQHGFTGQSAILLALGLTPLIISVLTVVKRGFRQHLTPLTLACVAIAVMGIVLWRITARPDVAVMFSIVADIFATLPTLHKSYKDPDSEYAFPYFLSIASMLIALLTIKTWTFTIYAFPLYMLGINITLFSFAHFPLQKMLQGTRERSAFESIGD